MSNTGPTGLQGQDGLEGVLGPRGITGLTGLLGWGDGTTTGPTGNGYFKLLPASGTPITVTTATLGTTYYITSKTTSGLTFPASMSGITSGAFWSFQNTTGVQLTLTLSNADAVYKGDPLATSVVVPASSGFTMAYSGSNTSYIVL